MAEEMGDSTQAGETTKVWRAIDASANRAGEALRVLEDVARFVLDDPHLTRLAKELRHDLAAALAAATPHDLEAVIRSTGFFRAKAKSILGCAQGLVDRHGGEVPRTLDELVRLPGVGRKTANVVLGSAFGISSGVVVDTHVGRITRRLGLTKASDAVRAERDLVKVLPREHWIAFSHRLIEHGRGVCSARSPVCEACPLLDLCPRVGVKPPRSR